jgi:hypothetical protein
LFTQGDSEPQPGTGCRVPLSEERVRLRYAFLVRCSFLLAVLLVIGACDNGDTPTDPTDPPRETETFTGKIERNGSSIHPFTATAAGRVTATITSVAPTGSPAFGFTLGTWDPAFEVCTAVRTNNAATTNSFLDGTVVGITPLCVRLFDANATIPAGTPIDYTVTVERP